MEKPGMSLLSNLTFTLGSALGPLFIRLQGMTWRIRQHGSSYYHQRLSGSTESVVYSFWHREMLLLAYYARNQGIRVLISKHRDGELSTRIVKRLGFQVFRGSTTRGGFKALKFIDRIKDDPSKCDFGFTPDGPRGPAKKLQKGVIYAAARTGFPVVPIGVALDRCWELNSWDRFRIPKPFSRCFIYFGEAIPIEDRLDEEAIEKGRAFVESKMFETERLAEAAMIEWRDNG